MNKDVSIMLDPVTGHKLGTAKLTVTIADIDVPNSTLTGTFEENDIIREVPIVYELISRDAGLYGTSEAVNWDDSLNYRPIISCDDDSVEFTFVPRETEGYWTIVITSEPSVDPEETGYPLVFDLGGDEIEDLNFTFKVETVDGTAKLVNGDDEEWSLSNEDNSVTLENAKLVSTETDEVLQDIAANGWGDYRFFVTLLSTELVGLQYQVRWYDTSFGDDHEGATINIIAHTDPEDPAEEPEDRYDEYMFVNGEWEKIGGASQGEGSVDLDGYATEEYVDEAIANTSSGYGMPIKNQPYPDFETGEPMPYLSELWYDTFDEMYARAHIEEGAMAGGCTSVWKASPTPGSFKVFRNFDWKYDHTPEFIVHNAAVNGKHASIGISSKKITKPDDYKLVPFCMTDGTNDAGLFVSMHVIPNTLRKESIPDPYVPETINPIMGVKYMLDNYSSVSDVQSHLYNLTKILGKSNVLDEMGYDIQYFIADKTGSQVINFYTRANNPQMTMAMPKNTSVLTNFAFMGIMPPPPGMSYGTIVPIVFADRDQEGIGPVWTPIDGDTGALEASHIDPLSSGLERFNWAYENKDSIFNYSGYNATTSDLDFTNAYDTSRATGDPDTDTFWYSDFTTEEKPLGTPVDEYDLDAIQELYDNRDRDTGDTWQTVHSVMYTITDTDSYIDISMGLRVQESYVSPIISPVHVIKPNTEGPVAENVEYENTDHSDVANVEEALDKLFAKVYYVNPSCSLSASPAGGTFEIGHTIEGINFSWTVNKTITSQSLTGCTVALNDRTASYTTEFDTNKSFTLTVSDGTNSATSSVSYSFQPKVYYGSAAVPDTYNSSFCLGLTSSALKSSKAGTYALNVAANQYGFICMPKSYANVDTLIAKVGGFDTEIPKVATISLTNAKGYTQDYNIFKTTNSNLGSISAVIS